MNRNVCTNREQSARLLRCGVSADTADMVWTRFESDGEKYEQLSVMDESAYEVASLTPIPAWSLSALLSNVLPKHLDDFPFTQWIEPFSDGEICEIEDNDEHVLSGDVKLSYEETAWIVDYDWDGFTGVLPNSDNPIEACVRAIELLYANGYKFNEQ